MHQSNSDRNASRSTREQRRWRTAYVSAPAMLVALAAFFMTLAARGSVPAAQELRFFEADLPESDPDNFSANTSRDIANKIIEARKQILEAELAETDNEKQRAYRPAIRNLQDVLDDAQAQEKVTPVLDTSRRDGPVRDDKQRRPREEAHESPGQERWRSVLDEAEDMILGMPEIGRATYRDEMKARADVELDLALQANDEERLRRVMQRFALTGAGMRAARVLGAAAFERGEFGLAAFAWRRLLRRQLESETGKGEAAATAARLAHCYRALGRRSELEALSSEVSTLAAIEVRTGEDKRLIKDLIASELALTVDSLSRPAAREGLALPMDGLSGSALPAAPGSIANAEWRQALPLPKERVYNAAFMSYPEPEVPPFIPTLHRSLVLVNSGPTLSAFDFYSHRQAWSVTPNPGGSNAYHLREPDPNLLLTVAAAGDLAFAALENPLDHGIEPLRPDAQFGPPMIYPNFPVVRRALTAVEVSTGRVRWVLGGRYAPSGKRGAQWRDIDEQAELASFHHAVIVDGVLYAIATIRENEAYVYLYAIDPERGRPLWRVSLCQGQQENTMFGRAAREPLPGIPVYAEGMLYAVSNLGGVTAVDLSGRRIKWVARYQAMPRPFTRGRTTYYRKPTFANGAPALARDASGRLLLVVAPTDSCYLSALDASDGTLRWETQVEPPQTTVDFRFDDEGPVAFAGVAGPHAYVCKANQLYQYSLGSGLQASWGLLMTRRGTSMERNVIAGRPALCEGELIWPGAAEIVSVPVTGKPLIRALASSRSAPGPAGNLRVCDGALLNCTGINYLGFGGQPQIEARFDIQALLASIRATLARTPGDADALLRYALIASRLAGQGGITEEDALRALEDAYEAASHEPAHRDVLEAAQRGLFDHAMNRAAALSGTGDPTAFEAALTRAERYASGESRQLDLFRVREEDVLARGKGDAILAFYEHWAGASARFSVRHGPLPLSAPLYARLKHGEYAERLGRTGAAVEDFQLVRERASLDSDLGGLAAELDKRVASLIERHGREIYATVEARAQMALDAALALKSAAEAAGKGEFAAAEPALREIAQRYPHSVSSGRATLALLDIWDRRGELSEHLTELTAFLELRQIDSATAALWLRLADLHSGRGETVAAFMIIARLRRADPRLAVRMGEGSIELGKALEGRGAALDVHFAALPALGQGVTQEDSWTYAPEEARSVRAMAQPSNETKLTFASIALPGFSGIAAIDTATGVEAWRFKAPLNQTRIERLPSSVLICDGAALHALAPTDGKVLWKLALGGRVQELAFAGELAVAFVTATGSSGEADPDARTMIAVDCQLGAECWRRTIRTGVAPVMTAIRTPMIYAAFAEDTGGTVMLAVDLGSGDVRAQARLALPPLATIGVDAKGRVLLPTAEGTLEILNGSDLSAIASVHHDVAAVRDMLVAGERAALVGHNGGVALITTHDARLAWQQGLSGRLTVSNQWLSGETVVVAVVLANKQREVRLAGFNMADGELRYNLELAKATGELDVFYGDAAALRDGVALLIRQQETFADAGGRRRKRWVQPRLVIADTREGRVVSSDTVGSAGVSASMPSLAVLEGGVAIGIEKEMVFLPAKVK